MKIVLTIAVLVALAVPAAAQTVADAPSVPSSFDERFRPFVGKWELDARAPLDIKIEISQGDGTIPATAKYFSRGQVREDFALSFSLDGSTPVLKVEGPEISMTLKHSPSQRGMLWGTGRRGGRDISPRFYRMK